MPLATSRPAPQSHWYPSAANVERMSCTTWAPVDVPISSSRCRTWSIADDNPALVEPNCVTADNSCTGAGWQASADAAGTTTKARCDHDQRDRDEQKRITTEHGLDAMSRPANQGERHRNSC